MNKEKELIYACIDDFYTFFVTFWDCTSTDELQDNWHLHYLCDQLENYGYAIANREDIKEDFICNVSPSTTKSSVISQSFNAWLWLHAPWACVISSSYSYDLSRGHASKTKDIITSDKYQRYFQGYYEKRHGKKLKFKKSTERYYENNFNGFRFSCGTDGGVMGRHAHLILIDDPMSMSQASSGTYREKANKFNVQALGTRKRNQSKCLTILVMQRLHHNDTTQYMLDKAEEKNKPINHVVLPALLSDKLKPYHLNKFYENGYFDPKRLSKEVLEGYKVDLGSYGFSGQFKQEPSPQGGGKVKRDWFQYCEGQEIPDYATLHLFVDGAYTDNTKNDPTGLAWIAHDDINNRLYIVKFEDKHLTMPAMIDYLGKSWERVFRWSNKSRHYLEPKATGISLHQHIIANGQNSTLIKDSMCQNLVSEGKESRLNSASPKIENGQIYLLKGSWNELFVDQICNFPNEEHDEAVDLLGYACAILLKKRKNKGVKHLN